MRRNSTATPTERLITGASVGLAHLGKKISEARQRLAPFQVRRNTLGDGAIAYEVGMHGETVMHLIPAPIRPGSSQIDESCLLQVMAVIDPG